MSNRHDIPVNKPLSILDRPLIIKFKDLFRGLTKSTIQGMAGKADGAIRDAIDSLSAVSFGNDASGVAWLLIFRSLLQAIYNLVAESEPLLIKDPQNPRVVQYKLGDLADDPDSLLNQLDWTLEQEQFAIDEKFFKHPETLPVLEDVKKLFTQWLARFGLTEAQTATITDRLPSFFVFALQDQWRSRSDEYALLTQAFDTPFTKASEREQSWARYSAWLQRQVDERMFDEAFSLRQVYVSLRAYYVEKVGGVKDDLPEHKLRGEKEPQRFIVELEAYLEEWLRKDDAYDAVKVISGGPGSGKSSFAKMFAAHQSANAARRVLFIPLHRFDPSDDLINAVGSFVRFDQFLTHNPLDPVEGDKRLLIIFDGLDELSEQGRAGAEIAQQFVAEVQKKVSQFNNPNSPRLKVIISGRELVVQANASEFRRPEQIINVLPYLIQEHDRKQYKGNDELAAQDQRPLWWKAYGAASGKGYAGLPGELNRKELLEITSQPLLNYLVALNYKPGKIDFSTETNINNIYEDLLVGVYSRRWEPNPHPATKNVKKRQFVRILEEVAVSVWHGDGRKTSLKEIEAHCESSGLKGLLDALKVGAKEGVTGLLMAFYFRRADNDLISDPTFEFTHKSFSEYLAARRIASVVAHLHDEMERREENIDSGYDERRALEDWLKLCGPVAMDRYVFDFIRNEMLLREIAEVGKWQDSLIRLINFVLRNGMPVDRLSPRPAFQEEYRQARNAEESLLCLLNICATITERVSVIDWPTPHACGEWIGRLYGQSGAAENILTLRCLSYLNLEECVLDGRDLGEANLRMTNLKNASLAYANLTYANLTGATLLGCKLDRTNLYGAALTRVDIDSDTLTGANLEGVILGDADLREVKLSYRNMTGINLGRANLEGANLERGHLGGAYLGRAKLKNANLEGATLLDAFLVDANLTGANLKAAYLVEATLFEAMLKGANLKGASLKRADLREAILCDANLEGADLSSADLRRADLNGANLKDANLAGAKLEEIKLDDEELRKEYLERAMAEDPDQEDDDEEDDEELDERE